MASVAEGHTVELGPLEVQVHVGLPREADAAVDLQRRLGHPHRGQTRSLGQVVGGVLDSVKMLAAEVMAPGAVAGYPQSGEAGGRPGP